MIRLILKEGFKVRGIVKPIARVASRHYILPALVLPVSKRDSEQNNLHPFVSTKLLLILLYSCNDNGILFYIGLAWDVYEFTMLCKNLECFIYPYYICKISQEPG